MKYLVLLMLVLGFAMCQNKPTQTQLTPAQNNQIDSNQTDNNQIDNDPGKVLITMSNSRSEQLVFSLKNDSIYCNNESIMFVNDGFTSDSSDPWDESDIYKMAYFRSPDDKQLFVALKPSIAGSCDIFYKVHIYRIDIESLDVQWITNCGGVKITSKGFETAEQVERLNPESSCAEARFTARNIYYDYNGKKVGESKVMNDKTVLQSYRTKSPDEYVQCLELTEDKQNIYSLYL